MDFLNYFSRNQHIRNYKKRYSDFKEENHCRPMLLFIFFGKRITEGEFAQEQIPQ